MTMIRLAGLCLAAALICATVRSAHPQIAAAVALACGVGVLMLSMLTIASFASAIPLPFIFKLGVEKGRAAYYVLVGLICGISVMMTGLFRGPFRTVIRPNLVLVLLAVVGVGIYALSWYLSVVFYRKREL